MKNRLAAIGFTLFLSTLIISGCGTDSGRPTQVPTAIPTQAAADVPQEVRAAGNAALTYVVGQYGDQAPPVGLTWAEENVTPGWPEAPVPGWSEYRFTAEGWVMAIGHAVLPPEQIVYEVTVTNQATGFQWQGDVNAAGRVAGSFDPTPEVVRAPNPARARDAALAYISQHHGIGWSQDAPPPERSWTEQEMTPEGLVGTTNIQYSADDWVVKVSFPLVAPEATIYRIVAIHQTAGFRWEGEADATGQVTEQHVTEAPRPSEIVSLDETWNQYTNYQLRFTIKFPRTMVTFNGACTWNKEQQSYRHEMALVPVETFEDADAVYIAGEYYHELTGERTETTADGGARYYFGACNQVTNALTLLRDPENHNQQMWKLVVKNIHDDNELESFIKSRYGAGCSLGEKTVSRQEGVYDVRIQGDGKDLAETQCPLNYGTVVKYYPSAHKVIAWDLGQAYTFPADVNYSAAYDQEMVESFRFLTETPILPPIVRNNS